jgi:diguanylate cyclase (GGDEF)-like protein/PAS domain S-box-containing protein
MNTEDRYPIPDVLQEALAVAVAYIAPDGSLLAANAGFLRLLPEGEDDDVARNVASAFIQPRFSELVAIASVDDASGYQGLLTLGSAYISARSLKGQLARKGDVFFFFAEHAIEAMEALQQSVLDLNTELADSQRLLSHANRSLERQVADDTIKLEENQAVLNLMAKVFANTGEGILITDAANRIIQINAAFSHLTGFTEAEVLGKDPKILSAGITAKEVYAEMWSALAKNGCWQGELWDRRKTGEIYPKWLSINVIRDKHGKTSHHIGSFSDISERKSSEAKILHLAYHDPLTQLPNRLNLYERLTQTLNFAKRNDTRAAVMLIDLDQFKAVNDTLGHHVGDQLLIEVASRLKLSIRDSDIVARLGGDEFVVVLSGIESDDAAAGVARKISQTVSAPYLIAGNPLRTSPSIGISIYPDNATEIGDLVRFADVAMYDAKARGRGIYQFYAPEMSQESSSRMALEADLRSALEKHQFLLHYQPQLDLRTGRLTGVEALVRWQHPTRGLVPPAEFIPLAEEIGLIAALGDWVMRESCQQLGAWRKEGITHIRMSVNLSPIQFQDGGLTDRVQAILEQYGLPSESLDLEITESMAMNSPDETIAMLRQLEETGVLLSIDDFGTGYSSLAYLKLFPLHTLKIDRSFVKDIETDPNDADICDVIVLLAHKLGLEVIAEGVETQEQLKFLISIGCERLQGYLLSKPLPADAARVFILAHTPLTDGGQVALWGHMKTEGG